MSHTYTKNHFHIVFSTRGRRKLISKRMQPELWAYTAGICKNVGIWVHAIGGIEDHVHALIELPVAIPLPKAVNLLKSNSSRFMNRRGSFSWQEGVRFLQRKRFEHSRGEEIRSQSGGDLPPGLTAWATVMTRLRR
jgi:REP element-mobilizing transposase RayT